MLSVTTLSSYLYCPRKLYLQKVLGIYEPIKEALVKGSIRHKVYENINLADEGLVKSIKKLVELEELKGIYHQKYREILLDVIKKNKDELKKFDLDVNDLFKNVWPLILAESETRASTIHNFVVKNNMFGDELWAKLTPKIESELRIESEALGLKGVIDQIEIYENGFVPIELKTGKSPNEGVWPGHRIQLVAYALLMEDKFKTDIKEGFVHYLDSKQRRHIAINPFMKIEIKELVEKVNGLLSCEEIPNFEKNNNKCVNCGIKEECYDEKGLKERLKKRKAPKS
ncbi:MAG: CRISPR-associated protein Cas4 [Nanoarchaeota archaeon]|nr:CRISPR-associated protein Cas4 [Nanoarchaeota archaeon]MBU1004366.1 CRISPR-associated protein Cas4 [Nanoarchaeota archaeon]MBU1946747.1 CRISPR-associated protein Cas4 [Nanoarchaeota archaeon]